MSKLAFISYRRDDTSQIAQALYLQLKEAFGPGQIFMVLRTDPRMWAKDVMWLRGILKQHGLSPVPEPVKPMHSITRSGRTRGT